MGLTRFIALTAGEFSRCACLNFPVAWMACHFSPYHTGLSNLPEQLPQGSLIMINDSAPIYNHDSHKITQQLQHLLQDLQPKGFVLDFQRPDFPENKALAEHLVNVLPCPVAVSDLYAQGLSCPVFLSAPPLAVPLDRHIKPWKDREIWLEAVLTQETLTLTGVGCDREETFLTSDPLPYCHQTLHCQYDFVLEENQAVFTLRRTETELSSFLRCAESLGITTAISLYQQMQNSPP